MQNNQAIPFNKENFKLIISKEFALVIIISVPSAIIAEFFNVPLAWFLGPMLITSLASLMGLKIKMPKLVLSSILILLGLYIGNYIDKSLFSQMHQWAFTSLIMLIYIVVSVLIVSKYLQIFSKYGIGTIPEGTYQFVTQQSIQPIVGKIVGLSGGPNKSLLSSL